MIKGIIDWLNHRTGVRKMMSVMFLEGIPGSVGGALRMNAGAMGSATFDVIESVRLMDFNGNARQCAKRIRDGDPDSESKRERPYRQTRATLQSPPRVGFLARGVLWRRGFGLFSLGGPFHVGRARFGSDRFVAEFFSA